MTRDLELKVVKGPARADPEGGVVQSVSEKPVANMTRPVAFQPQGSVVAGFQILKSGNK